MKTNNNNNYYYYYTSSLVITALMNSLSKSNAHLCVLKSLTRASIFIGIIRWVSVLLLADDGGCCCCCKCNVWYARMHSFALQENFRTLSNVNTFSEIQCLTVFQKFSFFLLSFNGCWQKKFLAHPHEHSIPSPVTLQWHLKVQSILALRSLPFDWRNDSSSSKSIQLPNKNFRLV